ncbi:hypothetical protein ECC02_001544 [Trypanosoma cruzi]|uniref:Uncharacterized protein n=1 Tax=Trypanosoma cruzi TaxID=5693 RepID=A0A7J6YG18_TRYCR|nr:hypothetical protein ECC02_001544 [Trypanosoma cruzi]
MFGWCCSWSTAATLYSPPHVELQRRNHHKSHGEVPSQHPCGEASHSHRPTAASRCRWLQRTLAAVSSRSPNGVGRGTRTAGWSVRHAAALQRLSVKQPRPTASAATRRVQPTPTPPHYRPFSFCFIHVVCLFAPSPTPKISAHLHKREGTKRKGGTIPPSRRGSTLSSTHHHCRAGDRSHIGESAPQCPPHHHALNDGRDAATHRPAPFSHHSSVACPHKVANRIRVHTNRINTLTR